MAVSKIRTRKQKVFSSVFEPQIFQPTPFLPATESGVGGESAASLTKAIHSANLSIDQARWDRAWHVVTSRISLPSSVAVEDSFGTLASKSQDLDDGFYSSLSIVLDPCATVPHANHTEDLLLWHTQQVRQHFVNHVLPLLAACASQGVYDQVLVSIFDTLKAAHRQYVHGLHLILRGIKDEIAAYDAKARFRRDIHAIIGNSWTEGLLSALRNVLRQLVRDILGSCELVQTTTISGTTENSAASKAQGELFGLLESMEQVGLAGEKFQILFAEVMDACMTDFIKKTYTGLWHMSVDHRASTTSGMLTGCMTNLCDWVENYYGHLAVKVFNRLGAQIRLADLDYWKEIAIGRLATLRIQELFDIVLHWPDSRGGIEDLRSAVTTPQRRLQLTDTFSAALQKQLLHPGSSTLHILQTYISMIKTFHALDHSKVLLDRVVHALQLYLCQRDDAIRIVVTGLLSSPQDIGTAERKTKLVELAILLNDASQQQRRHADDDGFDWNDMSWVPDPVDAGVNYKRPKTEDVIGTLIAALGSQDIFIKEFQSIIAERLLSPKPNFLQEVKVLSLLKKHFSENSLQNCDVMMKDIHDSKRVDLVLSRNLEVRPDEQGHRLSFHTKILSRLFWPSLPKEPFTVPLPILEIQDQYGAGFEHLKSARKLSWLDHLGSATIRLDLEDRSIELDCKTYEAAVIYAFQDSKGDVPAQRTYNELWEKLMIDEDLLEAALQFWILRKVIRDIGNQTYVVLERLNDGGPSESAVDSGSFKNGAEESQPSPRKAKGINPKEQEQRGIYWQFIVGMLTNSSPAMPLGQILMMMKMLIADGCPWSNEELQEFLDEKIQQQELELIGGKYRLPKK